MILPTAPPSRWRVRVIGALLGAAIPTGIAALGATNLDALVVPVIGALVGIPVGALFGWWRSPTMRAAPEPRDAFDQVLLTAVLAVPAGAIALSTVLAFGGVVGGEAPNLAMLAAILPYAIIGLVIFGLPALAFTIVVIGLWAAILRHLPRRLVGPGPRAAKP